MVYILTAGLICSLQSLKDLSLTMNGSLTHFWPHAFPLWISMSDSPFPEKFTRWESNPIHEVTLNQMDLQHWQGQNTKSPCNKIFVFQSSESPNPNFVFFFQLWRNVKVRSLIPSIYVTQCDSSLRVQCTYIVTISVKYHFCVNKHNKMIPPTTKTFPCIKFHLRLHWMKVILFRSGKIFVHTAWILYVQIRRFELGRHKAPC